MLEHYTTHLNFCWIMFDLVCVIAYFFLIICFNAQMNLPTKLEAHRIGNPLFKPRQSFNDILEELSTAPI